MTLLKRKLLDRFDPVTIMLVFATSTMWLAGETAADEPPNIILVMADDQGWGDMAYNGHPFIKTPNFDKAAAAGLRFDRFYAAAPVCSPTRASVMTGRHPNRMGVIKWGHPMRPQETTVAEALKTAGYSTGHFGKWHLGSVRNNSPAHPGRNGFDYWLSAPNFYDNDSTLSLMGKAVPQKGESSFLAVDAAIDWIEDVRQQTSPFMAVVWFGSPHGPHRAAEEDRNLYEGQTKQKQHFYGEITGMDRAYGKLREAISEMGIRDNTVLWYCSDNGALPKIGSSGGRRGAKGKIYDGGLVVPAILEWPAKIKQPRSTSDRCNTCDIYPTIMEIAGVNVPNQPILDGESLVPLIQESGNRTKPMGFWDYVGKGVGTPSDEWMDALLKAQSDGGDLPADEASMNAAKLPDPPVGTDHFPGHSAWIDGNLKLHRIETGKKGKFVVTWELYDLQLDPNEANNLIGVDTQSQAVAKMKLELETWLISVVNSLNGKDYLETAALK